jgi:glycolate oxidase iron-sulfur subunit
MGCVQPAMAPNINSATARVLDAAGIQTLVAAEAGCCGAIHLHGGDPEGGLDHMRRNIDAWWPHIEQGAEALVITASGCGVMVKDYGHLLQGDPAYAEKARRVSALAKDVSEVIAAESERVREITQRLPAASRKIAFHSPCTLQHGLKLPGVVESLLTELGFDLVPVRDSHLCCGSAGTYSILQPELSQRLLARKLDALTAHEPSQILTANIGCQSHLQTATGLPVTHWIEALDARLG